MHGDGVYSSKPWLKHYPPNVPAEIDWRQYDSLSDLLEESFRKYASRNAAMCMDVPITFRQIEEMSSALGAWLQKQGLQRGARVAIMMPNVLPYPIAIAAILRAGYVVVNVNPLYTARELEHQLKDSGAEAIIILENFAATLEEVIEHTAVRHVVLAAMGDLLGFWKGGLVNFVVRHVRKMVPEYKLPVGNGRTVTRFNDVIAEGSRLHLNRPQLGPDDVAFLQYTGGTTGVSKGATLLHRNVVANIIQTEAWFKPVLDRIGDKQLTVVCALPLYHIFALTVCYMMGARLGMMNLLIPNPRDIPGFVKTLQKHRVNMFPAVNTLFNALANDPDFARLDFSELVVSNGGGMAVQQATAEKWLKITGCPVVEGYGLSETSPVVTSNRLDLNEFTGTIGLPFPSTEVAIRDDDGNDVPIGEPGEICIRGPQVMAGYWNRPDETAKVMTSDGFFRSGDVGIMDERGYIKIVDRKKDMILVSGFNVYPNEIEQVVNLHPGVLECAAIGVPDAKSGEAVKLFVVKKDPTLTEDDLMAYCRDNFTGYKRPKYIEFRDELPKSNVGKILRRELRSSSN
ncbi:long-chain-fatty-acid--CoA ligase [Caldimonas thermodepolymerans]|jgi:long-chain acyl-CoA synthetase|uniref:Long-chain-fatty-acid--CoA ligase n=1 Tax=Caldimonas thermodepolymerans TaxID=215580 RepID=A0A2S5T313_9BURK|nr:long-chain-fatty-acid--CoA ligase [Caldimonas thermodepolymerans]PPE69362.1 long-chain fatty acid--CoA ligase [Caldimonas thermodepolymerans]QPC31090.1 long-chain-fatty-acid--CoA ligase [Caldimonas thermodepolymerans]RDH96182.1 long-chain acyl-CoA synthetase [Caldimonas thermodepolymerans]TCP04102.1 long-chain acyl-CoA synthetase [Caldimonas thermodepolymerans]UZG43814.1 long-chain-fatty-acid--CoA ligase [Caldimonas thermodepolymerans]